MANIKITDLTAYTAPRTTDVMPIVDVTTDTTKKVAVGEVVGKITGDVDVATDGTSSIAAGAIVNADVNASAAIAGTKIAPNFGSQTIETTGVINAGSGTAAAPSVSVGTTDNGLYFPGEDQVALSTNGTEHVRIDNEGSLFVGNGTTGTIGTMADASNLGIFSIDVSNSAAGAFLRTSRDVGSTGSIASFWGNSGLATIKGDGDLENTNNRYTGISDIKFKQNIEDASSQWEDVKAIQVRKYELIAHPERKHIGVVAQELEQVCPGLVIERQDEDTKEAYKSVAYSVLYMKAVKALQEAMERIESLEAKIAALESA